MNQDNQESQNAQFEEARYELNRPHTIDVKSGVPYHLDSDSDLTCGLISAVYNQSEALFAPIIGDNFTAHSLNCLAMFVKTEDEKGSPYNFTFKIHLKEGDDNARVRDYNENGQTVFLNKPTLRYEPKIENLDEICDTLRDPKGAGKKELILDGDTRALVEGALGGYKHMFGEYTKLKVTNAYAKFRFDLKKGPKNWAKRDYFIF